MRLRCKRTARELSFRYLRLTSFEQVQLRVLKKRILAVQGLMEMSSHSAVDTSTMSDLDAFLDVLLIQYMTLCIERPKGNFKFLTISNQISTLF